MLNKVILPYLVFVFYRLLQLSWRIHIDESKEVRTWRENNSPFIIAHWHGDELGILHLLKAYHVACIISTSKDGDIMNKAVKLLGAETVRGSSTRGGTGALKGIIRLKKQGWRPSVAVDGPKGPIYKAKSGVFQISRLTQLPIAPISFHASRTFLFKKSWNKAQLPLPFAKIQVCWGTPLPALTKQQDPKSKEWAAQLEKALNEVKKRASSGS